MPNLLFDFFICCVLQTLVGFLDLCKHESICDSFAGNETLRCLALALKRMPSGQQTLSYDDEQDLTFIGLVCFLFIVGWLA